jgi:hypothetical protein
MKELTRLQQWQVAQYLVNNIYPDIEDADSPAVMGAKIIVTPVAQET